MSGADLPRYRCHKEVRALKIASLDMVDGGWTLTPADTRYPPFAIPFEYVAKHSPKPGGYYVVYEDGYTSYSPAAAFEAGYTLIDGGPRPIEWSYATLLAYAPKPKPGESADEFHERTMRWQERVESAFTSALEAAAAELKRQETADPALVVYPRPAPSTDTCIDGDIDLAALVRAVLGAGG